MTSNPALLESIQIETGPEPSAAVIWLHGVGADGHAFELTVREFVRPGDPAIRFILPHAPVRPFTLGGGQSMRAWYDIRSQDRQVLQDEAAIRASAAAVEALIARESARGVPANRLMLGGFSQGGSMALFTGTRFTQPLAGIVALSCYRLLAGSFAAERQPANQATPIFLAHGSTDPVIPLDEAKANRAVLERDGYPVQWHSYPMGHELIAAEIVAIAAFVRQALGTS